MNCSISLFGDFGHGYTQYPYDGTESVFKKLVSKASAKTQLAIHRNGELIYYCYIRKLDSSDSHYFGICVLLNGVMLSEIKSLFESFEKSFTTLVVSGDILRFAEDGGIVSSVDSLSSKPKVVESIQSEIRFAFSAFDNKTNSLPPVKYGISAEEIKVLTIEEDPSVIADAITSYSYCLILKASDYDTIPMLSYRGMLKKVNDERHQLEEQNKQLEGEIKRVQRQKKQFKYLIIGIVCLLIACIKLFDLNKNLDYAKQENENLNQMNEALYSDVATLQNDVDSRNQIIYEKNNAILFKERMLSAFKNHFNYNRNYIPTSMKLVIENQENDSVGTVDEEWKMNNSLRLRPQIEYLSDSSIPDSIMLRWYLPSTISDSVYYYRKYSFDFSQGHHILNFPSWKSPNGSNWEYGHYRVEIWSFGENEVCLKKKDFWIY